MTARWKQVTAGGAGWAIVALAVATCTAAPAGAETFAVT